MKINLTDRTATRTGAYAVRELKRWLSRTTDAVFCERGGDLSFSVETDEELPVYA